MQYTSIQDVLDSKDVEGIKQQLRELDIEFHHMLGEKKLAQLLYDNSGAKSTIYQQNPPKKKETKSSASDWESLGEKIAKKTSNIKVGTKTKTKHYISKNYNLGLQPMGASKRGTMMRYIENCDTLDIAVQKETMDVFPQEYIKFRGVDGSNFVMNGFIGRGILSTPVPALQEFIENHKNYGSQFTLYDKEEITRIEFAEDMKITEIKYGIYKASDNDLVCTLAYLDMGNGKDSFTQLYNTVDKNKLRYQASQYAKKSPDTFLRATGDKEAKVIMLINLAREHNMVDVSADGTSVRLVENNTEIVKSSRASNWQNDLKNHLFTPDGRPLAAKMELVTGYNVF